MERMPSHPLPTSPAAQGSEIVPGISSRWLASGIGNLFYDALGDFLRALSGELQAHATDCTLLAEATVHIDVAWKICRGRDENHPKHARQVPGVALTLAEIARQIAALPAPQQQLFFAHLAEKLHQDGISDEKRGRTRLAQALFAAAACIGKMG